jgi:hypothetical protein
MTISTIEGKVQCPGCTELSPLTSPEFPSAVCSVGHPSLEAACSRLFHCHKITVAHITTTQPKLRSYLLFISTAEDAWFTFSHNTTQLLLKTNLMFISVLKLSTLAAFTLLLYLFIYFSWHWFELAGQVLLPLESFCQPTYLLLGVRFSQIKGRKTFSRSQI